MLGVRCLGHDGRVGDPGQCESEHCGEHWGRRAALRQEGSAGPRPHSAGAHGELSWPEGSWGSPWGWKGRPSSRERDSPGSDSAQCQTQPSDRWGPRSGWEAKMAGQGQGPALDQPRPSSWPRTTWAARQQALELRQGPSLKADPTGQRGTPAVAFSQHRAGWESLPTSPEGREMCTISCTVCKLALSPSSQTSGKGGCECTQGTYTGFLVVEFTFMTN